MKKHDFTLVELLVVIGIIGILAGMVLGAIGLARAGASGAKCRSNQSETMKVIKIAMSANKDFLVSGNDFSDSPGKEAAWTRFLYGGDLSTSIKGKTPYITEMAMLRCPSFKYDKDEALGALGDTDRKKELAEAYGVVYRASAETGAKFAGFDFRGTKFLKMSDYQISPNQLVLGGCASQNTPYDQAQALLYTGSAWEGKFVNVHSDKCNVFFLDGHSEELAKDELEKKYLPSATGNEPVKFPSAGWIDVNK